MLNLCCLFSCQTGGQAIDDSGQLRCMAAWITAAFRQSHACNQIDCALHCADTFEKCLQGQAVGCWTAGARKLGRINDV